MSHSKFDAQKVAKMARLSLAQEEVEKLEKDLENILEAFGELDKVETDCEPSFQPVPMKNSMREDSVEKSLSQSEALSGTEHKDKGFFKGPRAI